jgi:hypothetical protein
VSRAQHILAVIVGLITGVLLVESYGAMVTAARVGGRAIPELWPLGTEALALAHGSLGAGGQAAGPPGRAAAVVAAANRLRRPVHPAPRSPSPRPPWSAT